MGKHLKIKRDKFEDIVEFVASILFFIMLMILLGISGLLWGEKIEINNNHTTYKITVENNW